MGAGKWIGGILGFMAGGPLGALAGFALGAFFDNSNVAASNTDMYGQTEDNPYAGRRNSFLFSMLVMASYIIRADGRIMHSEMEYVRRFLRQNFGEQAVREGEQILLNLFEERKRMDAHNPNAFRNTIRDCGAQIAANLSYEERLQLLSFLAEIAKSDGHISQEEVEALKEVAVCMGLSIQEAESMLNLGGNSLEQAYKVLEVTPEATDQEIRAAYRRLALKHHPDRVATLGEDVRRAAEEKFQEINNAKEQIYKARGMKYNRLPNVLRKYCRTWQPAKAIFGNPPHPEEATRRILRRQPAASRGGNLPHRKAANR